MRSDLVEGRRDPTRAARIDGSRTGRRSRSLTLAAEYLVPCCVEDTPGRADVELTQPGLPGTQTPGRAATRTPTTGSPWLVRLRRTLRYGPLVDIDTAQPPAAVSRRDRITGALLGVHVGDALGAGVEFESWEYIRFRHPDGIREILGGGTFDWPPGHATDDTDLTRAVLLACLDPGDDVVRTAARHMLDWYQGRWPGRVPGARPRDVGAATEDGLRAFARTGDPRRSGAGPGRAGNGSLMRCLPTALVVADPDRRRRESMEISAITHDDPRCTVACAAYNDMVADLLAGAAPGAAVEAGLSTADGLGAPDVAAAITTGRGLHPADLMRTGQTGLPDDAGGFVLDSLSLAVAALLDPRPFAEVIVDIVGLGNDTDTNAAIAGGLLGARDGVAAIPPRWLATLEFQEEFTRLAEGIAAR